MQLVVQIGDVPFLVRHLCIAVESNEPHLCEHEIARDCALALTLIASKVSFSVKYFLVLIVVLCASLHIKNMMLLQTFSKKC